MWGSLGQSRIQGGTDFAIIRFDMGGKANIKYSQTNVSIRCLLIIN